MTESSSIHPYGSAIAVSVAGVVLAWLSGEISGLLAVVAAVYICRGGSPGIVSIGICGLAFGLFFLLPGPDLPPDSKLYLRFAAFLTATIAIGLLIRDNKRATLTDRAEHQARLIVESMPGLGWSTDADGNVVYVSPSVLDYTGVRSAKLDPVEGPDIFAWVQRVHPEDVDYTVKSLSHSLQTGEPYEAEQRIRRFDGIYRWCRSLARPARDPSGRVSGWYGTTIDIDDQKKAEETLRSSEMQLRLLIDAIPALVWRATPDGEPCYFNKRLIDYTGMTLDGFDDLKGSSRKSAAMRALVHPDDLTDQERLCSHSFQTGESIGTRYRLRRTDGVYRWVEARVEPLRSDDGRIVQWYGVCVDVDDRQKAEEALRSSEQQLRLLIDTIPALVWSATPDGEPSYLNKRLIDYTGVTLNSFEDLAGGSLGSLARRAIVHPDELVDLERLWSHSVQSGQTLSIRHRLRRVDGVYRWVDLRAEPLRNDDGGIVQWYGVFVDIEDQTRMQEALRATQDKLSRASQAASLAELSASIAHEVNQPLAALVANSHACERWLSAEPPNLKRARIAIERIIRDANAAAEVVSRIRALFRQTALTKTSVNLNEVIAEVCQLISDCVPTKGIKIETDIDKNLPSVLADRVQLQQVLVNLIRNGIDAMASSTYHPKSLLIRSRQDGMNAVLVEVRDRGSGVEGAERIFEPFFTTKHNGMGMGLAICRSIIEAHDGQLRATKNEPRGTTFTFTLPRVSE